MWAAGQVGRRSVGGHPGALRPGFTLSRLQGMYQLILGRAIDKRNFRKKVQSLGILEELDEVEQGAAGPPARLWRFDAKAYREKVRAGFYFEI